MPAVQFTHEKGDAEPLTADQVPAMHSLHSALVEPPKPEKYLPALHRLQEKLSPIPVE